jgi:1-acyl-sn-glycerol-3-phosphate acyltransferase
MVRAQERGMKDERSDCFKRFVWCCARAAIRRKFHSVLVWTGSILESAAAESPVIIFSNHSSWWDAFVDHMIERLYCSNHYTLVDGRTLETQGWLKKIGALAIDPTSARGAVAGLRAAREFLLEPVADGRHPVLMMFPQGKVVPAWKRPFGFQGGLAWLKQNVPQAALIPLARRFEFLREEKPQILLRFGPPQRELPPDLTEDGLTAWLEERLAETMSLMERDLEASDFSNARVILRGGWSLNKKWEWVKRCLTGKTRGFDPLN